MRLIRHVRFGPIAFALLFSQTLLGQDPSPKSAYSIDSPSTITAAFWNIEWFPGRRPNASRSEEQRQIRSVQRDIAQFSPDILALEEVRDAASAALAVQALDGFKVDVCSNFPGRGGQTDSQQIAITSRLQPVAAWAESWRRHNAILPPRGFAFAAYQTAPNHLLLVYALHLKSNHGEIHENIRIREESVYQLMGHINAMNARFGRNNILSWIVGGDFNTAPDEPRFARERTVSTVIRGGFHWAWEGIPLSTRITMPSNFRYPPAAFDQILYRGAILGRAWVAPTSPQSSDHRAVDVTLNLR
jgi:endonuclease/exonuclease/phosphatase family metal-dependent hydrolase